MRKAACPDVWLDRRGFRQARPRRSPSLDRRDAQISALESFTTADLNRKWTVREIAAHTAIGGRSPLVVGSAAEAAEHLIDWVDETGVDGFNLAYAVTPGTFNNMVDLVVPELQTRERYKRDYAPGTFREKLYGQGRSRLPATHPAARYRP